MSTGMNNTGQVSVGVTATLIIAGNGLRDGVVITNTGSATVFLGGQNVTTSTGHALLAGTSITVSAVNPLYGIVATSTVTVTFLEQQ